MIDSIAAASILGLLGSGHCAVMCGPLAMAGCGNRPQTIGYFAGRTIAYAFIGALLGALGRSFSIDGRWSLLLAALALAYGIWLLRRSEPELVSLPKRRSGVFAFIVSLLPRRGLGLGLVTGALPCGLLASAWLVAASTDHALAGASVMLAFSIASLPGLLAPLVLRRLASKLFTAPRALHGALWIVLAVWIATRALLTASKGCHG